MCSLPLLPDPFVVGVKVAVIPPGTLTVGLVGVTLGVAVGVNVFVGPASATLIWQSAVNWSTCPPALYQSICTTLFISGVSVILGLVSVGCTKIRTHILCAVHIDLMNLETDVLSDFSIENGERVQSPRRAEIDLQVAVPDTR